MQLKSLLAQAVLAGSLTLVGCQHTQPAASFQPLFPSDGIPPGWVVRHWSDVSKPASAQATWRVTDGVLQGSEPRGTWLVSEQDYGDFTLEFEWKLGPQGNSGCGLRFPAQGDPAFDGLELQMVDPRYYGKATAQPDELTGGLYRAVAPSRQVLKPEDWNRYEITCIGPRIKVVLNGETMLDLNLDEQTARPKRHDGSRAPPLRERPRRGRIGFQELSRGGGHVQIRHARIKALE